MRVYHNVFLFFEQRTSEGFQRYQIGPKSFRDTLGVLKYFNAIILIPKQRIKYKQEIDGTLLFFSAVHILIRIFVIFFFRNPKLVFHPKRLQSPYVYRLKQTPTETSSKTLMSQRLNKSNQVNEVYILGHILSGFCMKHGRVKIDPFFLIWSLLYPRRSRMEHLLSSSRI